MSETPEVDSNQLGACPDEATLLDGLEAGFGSRPDLVAHLDGCAACFDLVSVLVRQEKQPNKTKEHEMIGRYHLLHALGAGGMGVVFAARDEDLNRTVALKLVREPNPNALARTLREAQALARVSHPNVVTVYEVGSFQDDLFIAMEHVEGQSLAQWLAAEPRSQREILRVFLEAAHGLLAIHEAGIVHRDFKPENVLIGTDGRVRLSDFGLARQWAEGNSHEAINATTEQLTTLTRTGTLLGTPVYMAPEQLRGEAASAASDVFAFSVSLYEALYGRRPFSGNTIAELEASIERQAFPLRANKWRVPGPIRAVIKAGLARGKNDRPSSMREMLSFWERAHRRQRILRAVLIAVLGIATLLALALRISRQEGSCFTEDTMVTSVWNGSRRAAVRGAFRSIAGFGRDAEAYVTGELDRYFGTWTQAAHRNCSSISIIRPHTREAYELRLGCLEARLKQADALVTLFEAADSSTAEHASEAVANLRSIESCNQTGTLRQEREIWGSESAEASQHTGPELHRAEALANAGKHADAVALTRSILSQDLSRLPRLKGEALLLLGSELDQVGQIEEASSTLRKALWNSEGAKTDVLMARTLNSLIYVDGHRRNSFAQAQIWKQWADDLSGRIESDEITAQMRTNWGIVLRSEGRYRDAVAEFQQAILLQEQSVGQNHLSLAAILTELASALRSLSEYNPAATSARRALTIREVALGPKHPLVAASMEQLGEVLRKMGHTEEALNLFEQSLSTTKLAFGADHLNVAYSLNHLANIQVALGNFDRALDLYREALQIAEKTLPIGHPELAMPRCNIGLVLNKMGRYREALAALDESMAMLRTSVQPEHAFVGYVLSNRGLSHLGLQDAKAAREDYSRSIAIFRKLNSEAHAEVSLSLLGLSEIAMSEGDLTRAEALLREARQIIDTQNTDMPELDRCELLYLEAQVSWRMGSRAKARSLLLDAEMFLRKIPAYGQGSVAELTLPLFRRLPNVVR